MLYMLCYKVREEPYCTGGEEYLTFSHCTVNNGGNMDPKSGVFTATIGGEDYSHNRSHQLNLSVMTKKIAH